MANWLTRLLKRRPRTATEWPRKRDQRRGAIEAADSSRLNEQHWANAADESLNSQLSSRLSTVRGRAQYEALNNPLVQGVIGTHADDVVGPKGPKLQVQTEQEGYADALEKLWRRFWAMPDVNGRLAGPELLNLWVRSLWLNGELLGQIVTDPDAAGPVKARLRVLHPRRLDTPVSRTGDADVLMGVRRTRTGKPTGYYIDTTPESESLRSLNIQQREIKAEFIIHEFRTVDPDQVRGVPWLSPCLQAIADLRDYDVQVLDAARMAADMAVLLQAKNPDTAFVEVNETVEIERRMMSFLPPGYEAQQVTPQQPSTVYAEFRAERLRELGRAVGMPLMMVQLDSRRHNYSSARFDAQVYWRGIRELQDWLSRRVLERLVELVVREGELTGELPKRPADLSFAWIWPVAPHVDPLKEGKAATERLNNFTSCLRDEAIGQNRDGDELIEQIGKEHAAILAAGLPSPYARERSQRVAVDEDDVETAIAEAVAEAVGHDRYGGDNGRLAGSF